MNQPVTHRRRATRAALMLTCAALLCAAAARAEQKRTFGDLDVHYVVVPTGFLQPDVAQRYNLPRGRDRALVNISVLRGDSAVTAQVSGTATNLLGQIQHLTFEQVAEGAAIYYLAVVRHTNEEHLRFALTITALDGTAHELSFRQKMYWDES